MIRTHGRPGAAEQVDIVGGKTVSGDEGSVRWCIVLKKVFMTRVTPVKREENRIDNFIYVSHSVEVTMNEMELAFAPPAYSSPHVCMSLVTFIADTVRRQSFICASIHSLPAISLCHRKW